MKANRLSLAFAICAISTAQAQIQPDAATIAYLNSKPFSEITIWYGVHSDKGILGMDQCAGSYGFEPIALSILQPLQFVPTMAHPVAGAWTYRFKFKRCGSEKIYRAQWHANAQGQPQPVVLPPGMSRADAALSQTLKNAVGSIGVLKYNVPQSCRTMLVLDTQVSMEPRTLTVDGIQRNGVWEEEWTAQMCGIEFKTPICLTPVEPAGTNWASSACPKQ